jgi:hypothetical protein
VDFAQDFARRHARVGQLEGRRATKARGGPSTASPDATAARGDCPNQVAVIRCFRKRKITSAIRGCERAPPPELDASSWADPQVGFRRVIGRPEVSAQLLFRQELAARVGNRDLEIRAIEAADEL